jgi:nicotinamide-nucleotide adenylyltransferase
LRGLLVGRFQPFHRGHLRVISDLVAQRGPHALLIGIGSAQESFTDENPFTAGERAEMIERALAEVGIRAVQTVPIPDIHQHAQWVAYLVALVPPFDVVHTNNPLTRLLFERARFTVESPPLFDRGRYQGAEIRRRIRVGEPWDELVPPAVSHYLAEIGGVERIQTIANREARAPSSTVR